MTPESGTLPLLTDPCRNQPTRCAVGTEIDKLTIEQVSQPSPALNGAFPFCKMKSIQDPISNEPSLKDYVFSVEDETNLPAQDVDWPDGAPVPESVEETIDSP